MGFWGREDDTPQPEDECCAKFFAFRDSVRNTKGRTVIGDLVTSVDLESSWFDMADYLIVSNRVQNYYNGPIMFFLAHEIGHLVSGHFERLGAACDELETEADIYAAVLIEDMTRELAFFEGWGAGLGDDMGIAGLRGYDTFFDLAYAMAGFDVAGARADCRYPDPAERRAFVDKVFAGLREARAEAFSEQMVEAFQSLSQGEEN